MNIEFIILDAASGALLQFGQYPEQDFWALEGAGKIALAFPASGIAQTVAEGGTLIGLDLAVLKPIAIARVNKQAGEFRTRFITSIPGQEAVYLLKQQEAKAWTTGADPSGFPYLAAEAAATGVTIDVLVTSVLAISAAWGALSPAIEGARRGAITAIDAATYADSDQALREASEGPVRFQLLIIGRGQRVARLAELEPVVKACPKEK